MMLDLPDYELKTEISSGIKFTLFRGIRKSDGTQVLIKTFKKPNPTPHEIAQFRQESEVSERINDEGLVKTLSLEHYNNKYYLIMESIDGISLEEHLQQSKINIITFLNIGISLGQTLGKIHAKKIIHKAIHPGNVFINPRTGMVKIANFGQATFLTRENPSYSTVNALEGNLSYYSPEQTGRMNRPLDNRSDLYSLGITFYEMLAGELPFPLTDALSTVHSHITEIPKPLDTTNAGVPPVLAAIIHRLLEKNAEDRYQSAQGLVWDLKKCLRIHQETGNIKTFAIGEQDFSGTFKILQKLYGRSEQIQMLLDSYARVANGASESILLGGYSGVGKTALVNEIHKPITSRNGYFISGKFDQYQRDIPYFAVTQAFNALCELWQQEPDEVQNSWKQKILNTLGNEAQVLVDLIPGLEAVIGKQLPAPELPSYEAQQRLNSALKRFLKTVCQAEHPLCIFIDDLQWADSGSLQLLSQMITNPDSHHMLLIGAYRDNEVTPHHPLILTLNELKKQKTTMTSLKLEPLTLEDLGHMVSDALQADMTSVMGLSSLIYEKTNGNSFFARQFLKALHREGLLRYDFNEHAWFWNLDKIKEQNVTDNVVDLMAARVSDLSEITGYVLQMAACIGNKFELKLLSIITEKDPLETMLALWPALDQGLIIPLDNNYTLLGSLLEEDSIWADETETTETKILAEFKFIHDRVQQGAYLSIPEAETAEIHLNIARLLHRHFAKGEIKQQIFNILNQYEKSIKLITDPIEKLTVSKLCLEAAEQARKSSAFVPGLNFAALAVNNLLPEDSWDSQYELTVSLYLSLASCQYSAVRLPESEATCRQALKHCSGENEITDFYKIISRVLFGLNRHYEAVENSRQCLRILGVILPKNIGKRHIAIQYFLLRLRLGFRKVESLVDQRELSDKKQLNILRMLYDSVESTYIVAPYTMAYNNLLMAKITLKYGNSIYSGFALALTSLVQCGFSMELELGDRFCRTALEMNKKYPNPDVKGRINFLHTNFTRHWTNPIEEYESQVNLALQCFKDTGNLHWGTYSYFFCRTQSIFFNDKNLENIIEDNEKTYALFYDYKDKEVILQQNHILNFLYWLRGKEQTFTNKTYPFEPEEYERKIHEPGNFLVRCYYHSFNMIQEFMLDNYDTSLIHAKQAHQIVNELLGALLQIQVYIFYNLNVFQLRPRMTFKERTAIWLPFQINKVRLWYHSRKYPRTFSPYYLLHKAEEARLKKRNTKAEKYYDQAVKKSGELNYSHISALCNELAGKYFIERGQEPRAAAYLLAAHALYSTWGAVQKVNQLELKYSHILPGKP